MIAFSNSFAYIDPNAGFQIFSSMAPVFGMILAFLGILFLPLIKAFKGLRFLFRKAPRLMSAVAVILVVAGVTAAFFFYRPASAGKTDKKIIVLGMDGLDPVLLESMMDAGELPHFDQLRKMGSFSRLGTVIPPQSPVAWSSFATGMNAGGHGIYDFLWRHKDNYLPDLSLTHLHKPRTLHLFGLDIPLGRSRFEVPRHGNAFWTLTSQAGYKTSVIHCPITFPAEKVSGVLLSGMGVPDIRGTQGTFSFYTSNEEDAGRAQGGIRIPVLPRDGRIQTVMKGPWGPGRREMEVALEIEIDKPGKKAVLSWQGHEQEVLLNNWSPWIRVSFQEGHGPVIQGMTRFYLRSLEPGFELYASAFNFVPEAPVHPISWPHDYSKRLFQAIGDYHTLGMPHDTWAVNEGVMTEEMFLEQSDRILDEEVEMLKKELPGFQSGVFVFVVETPDRIQHMFWRAIDPGHPLYTPELAEKYGHVIPDCYKRMDDILGLVMGYMDERTTLMVISDHGFKTFRRAAHINSWLRDHGYLVYSKDRTDRVFFQGVDWAKSRAYAVGLGGVYVNKAGREGKGIVNAEDVPALLEELSAGFKKWQDPDSGAPVIRDVYLARDIYNGPMAAEAPDLVLGFEEGYRASWQTALGASPRQEVEDNLKKWSGDHIMDHNIVPGIFLSNRKLRTTDPTLYDIPPTILYELNLPIPEEMIGDPLSLD